MNYFLVILLSAVNSWSLTLARPNVEETIEQQQQSSRNLFYLVDDEGFLSAANISFHRVPRSLWKALDEKKSELLKVGQKSKSGQIIETAQQCCILADTSKPKIAEKIFNGLEDVENCDLDILLRSYKGPLTLADLLTDLPKDICELDLPDCVELSNKAVVEALLSKTVLLKLPVTYDKGIAIAEHRACVGAFSTGRLKLPLRDKFGDILSNLAAALPDGTKEVLGTLLGGNLVSDILESGALGLLNYPIKDAKGLPVVNRGELLALIAQGGFKHLKYPLVNAFGMELADERELLLILMEGGFLKNMVYPVRDCNGLLINNKQTFLKAAQEGLAFKLLQYPLRDSFGITIKRPDALMAALLDDDAARAVGFPLTDCKGAIIKDKLQLFLTLLDGGLHLVTFPLKDAQGYFFRNKLAVLKAIVAALREKQGLTVLLQRLVSAITKFPLNDKANNTLDERTKLLAALLDDQALSGLNFPLSDCEGKCIAHKEAFLLDLLNHSLKSFEFPLTNKYGKVLNNGLDLVDALMGASVLMGLRFPLKDHRGRLIKDKEQLLQHINKNDLIYPLNDCAFNQVRDFAELLSLLLDGEALDKLKFPLFDGIGRIFKNKADFLAAFLKNGLQAVNFPLLDAKGGVLACLENLLEALFNNSVLSQLVFPITDITGVVSKTKLEFLDSLLGGVLGLPKLNLNEVLCGIFNDVDVLLESLIGDATLPNLPRTDILPGSLNNTVNNCMDWLKASPGLNCIRFPLCDKNGRIVEDQQALLALLSNANALSALKFPLTDSAGAVFKNKHDFLRRVFKGLMALNCPLTDSAAAGLFKVLLQALLTLLKPVLTALVGVLLPHTNLIQGLLGGNLTILEPLLTANTASSPALRFPLTDAAGRNITNQLELTEKLLNGGLMALRFPLHDCKGHFMGDRKDFLELLLNAGALAHLQFPVSCSDGIVLASNQELLLAILNNNLQAEDFPLTDAQGLMINSKILLSGKLFHSAALASLNYPLMDRNHTVICSSQALFELLVDGGLSSFKYPIFDSGNIILEDKTALANILAKGLISSSGREPQTAKCRSGALAGLLKLMGDESSLSGHDLAAFKALKQGTINDKDLRHLLGNEKFSVLKDKLSKADAASPAETRKLRKILKGVLGLLLKKKPQLATKLANNFAVSSFT